VRKAFPLDIERSSKIRALALASRCLTRELTRLRDSGIAHDGTSGEESAIEIERLVHLARTILDPAYSQEPLDAEVEALALSATKEYPALGAGGRSNGRADEISPDLLGEGPPSARHSLALLGHGSRIPIPELVGFLGSLGIGGILKVQTRKERYLVEFVEGQIVHAEASAAPLGHRLGDILVAQESIDRIALEGASSSQASWKLGRRLLEKRLITREQLVRALKKQIQLLFCRLFRQEALGLTFWSGPRLYGEDGVRLNSTSLLLEGARASDEAEDGSGSTVEGDDEEGR
jgi:Domain of unknown function (DUF4388)